MIFNTHDQLKANGGGVAITVSHGGIRESYVDGWIVYRVSSEGKEIVTDPTAAWYHYKRKWFPSTLRSGTFHERQRTALAEAQAWVAAKGWYSGPWKRNRSGDFVPVDVAEKFPLVKSGATVRVARRKETTNGR